MKPFILLTLTAMLSAFIGSQVTFIGAMGYAMIAATSSTTLVSMHLRRSGLA